MNDNLTKTKDWQIALFALNGIATNTAMLLMNYYMFFTQNILGLSAVIVGMIATSMRIFDGVTDPIIGYMMDKTEGKFGKFRPYMVLGYVIISFCVLAIFNCPEHWSTSAKYVYTTVFYAIYIIGYTFQTACTKAAQSVLTTDPKQRPMFSVYNGGYNAILGALMPLIITSWMAPRYEKTMLNPQLWKDLMWIFIAMMGIFTLLAVIGIWDRDRKEFFGAGKQQIKFRDMWSVIKGNRPLQMLIIAASTDKLALQMLGGVQVYLFANVFLDNSLQGSFSSIKVLPVLIISMAGIACARKVGLKLPFIVSTWISMIALAIMFIIGASPQNQMVFLFIFIIQQSMSGISNNILNPMIADCTDYEIYRTGKFLPGIIGTIFTFVDKIISSFATTFIGFALAFAGVSKGSIPSNVYISDKFYWTIMFCICIIPIFGHIASIISMKFYTLTKEKMIEIQASNIALKEKINKA